MVQQPAPGLQPTTAPPFRWATLARQPCLLISSNKYTLSTPTEHTMTQQATREWAAAGIDFAVKDSVAWVTLNRPKLRNAVDHAMRNALLAAIEEIRDDPDIRVAVVTGAGTAFCFGADIIGRDPIEV